MTAVKTITRQAPGFEAGQLAKRQTLARWLCASALAVGALGTANQARANDLFWSVGVSSPGVQVAVGNAPQVVYQQPQVIYHQPQVVYQQPQVVYQQPQVVYQQPQVVHRHPPLVYHHPPVIHSPAGHPHRVVVPHAYGRPVVVMPQTVVYQRGWHRGWGHHPGHGPHHGLHQGQGWGHDGGQGGGHGGGNGGGHNGGQGGGHRR